MTTDLLSRLRFSPAIISRALVATLVLTGCDGSKPSSSPSQTVAASQGAESFRQEVEAAIRAGDAKALLALADMKGALGLQHSLLLGLLPDYAEAEGKWAVTIEPATSEWQANFQQQLQANGMEAPIAPEGLIVVKETSGSGRSVQRMPFGRVDGRLKLITARYSAAKLSELAATDPMKAAEKSLAEGLPDPDSSGMDAAWKAGATALPAGGGDPGAALVAEVQKLNAAVAAADPDAVMALTGRWGQAVFAAENYEGKPVSMQIRKLKVAAQATRFLQKVDVIGGWATNTRAALAIDAVDHSGNKRRGAVFMQTTDKGWEKYREDLVEIPVP